MTLNGSRPRTRRSANAGRVRAVAVLALVAYLVAGIGLLPSARQMVKWCNTIGARSGLSGERFMCEDCSCGCVSADECWANCCCHSLAERLAWAKRNGVAVPRRVLESAEAQALMNSPGFDDQDDACPCCEAEAGSGSCSTGDGHETDSTPWLPRLSALGCKGAAAMVLLCAPLNAFSGLAGLLPPPGAGASVQALTEADPNSQTLELATPPPRV